MRAAAIDLDSDDGTMHVWRAAMAEAGFPGAELIVEHQPNGWRRFRWSHPRQNDEATRLAAYRAMHLAGFNSERSKCWPCFRDQVKCSPEHEREWQ